MTQMTKDRFSGLNTVVLTGAGISSESGLKTFRDSDGLWEGHAVEDVATPEAFERSPDTVHRFYNLRRAQLKNAEPNAAHHALAQFENNHSGQFLLVTQNVDDLHERAGSHSVCHMHGELRKARCLDTGEVFYWEGDLSVHTLHPRATGKPGRLRPHICWFGEIPFELELIEAALRSADLLVVIGTSGTVYPAAGFVHCVPSHCRKILLNKEAPQNQSSFHEVILGPASERVPQFFST